MRARVVAVTSASRTAKDGKRVFVIECELDSVVWSVLRRERQVSELHVTLSQLMRFVPDSPIAPRSWIWGRAAEQDGAVAKRVERVEGLHDELAPRGREPAAHLAQEFGVVNGPRAVAIKVRVQLRDLLGGQP